MRAPLAAVSVAAAGLLLVSGCSKASTSRPTSSALPASPSVTSPVAPTPVTSTPAMSTPVMSTPAATTAAPVASFNGTCDDLLPVSLVNEALGRPVIGTTAFVVGVPEPNIGRLAYLNCRYGIPAAVKGKPAPTPQLEIGVSIYDSAAQAARRLAGTVEDYLSHGATQSVVPIGTYQATTLIGYHDPTIVAISGARTAAITVRQTLFVGTPQAGLTALAKAVLDATANSTEPAATPGAAGSVTAPGSVVAPSGPVLSGSPAAS